MIEVAFIPRLRSVIADVLAGFTDYVTEVEDFQDAVIANAGGIIPMVQFEYHTGIEAFRHGTPVYDSFVFDRVPYGFTDAGLIRLIDNTPIPFTGARGFTSLYTVHYPYDGIGRYQQIGGTLRFMQLRTVTTTTLGVITATNVLGQYQDFNGILGATTATQLLDYPSLITDGTLLETEILDTNKSIALGNNYLFTDSQMIRVGNLFVPLKMFPYMDVQYINEQWIVSIGNTLSFYDEDWTMIRYIKLDEPYYPSVVFNNVDDYPNAKPVNTDIAKRNMNAPGLPVTHYCKCLYASPYVYAVYRDRTVVYYVD